MFTKKTKKEKDPVMDLKDAKILAAENKEKKKEEKVLSEDEKVRKDEAARAAETRERKRREQIRREGHNAFWYLIPGNLQKEAALVKGDFSFKKNLATYLMYMAITAGYGIFFDMEIGYIIAMEIIMVLFVPAILVAKFRAGYQDRRFSDINIYMEQFLYSFKQNRKILSTLKDIRPTFDNSPIGGLIDKAIEKISAPDADEHAEEEALKELEGSYPCQKLLTIHKFALRVEKIGGDFESTSKLLLKDRNSWEIRNELTRAAKRSKMRMVTISIYVSLILCGLIVRLLPMALKGISIAHIPTIELVTVFIYALDMYIYTRVLKVTNRDVLTLSIEDEEEQALRRYYKIHLWNESTQFLKSLRYAVFPAMIFAFAAVMRSFNPDSKFHTAFMVISAVLTVVMLFQHRFDYSLTKKGVERQIMEMFPRWLIDMALLLQTDSVQVALQKSYADAPAILKPELSMLYDKLEKKPDDINPYIEFMQDFDVRGIQSAMKMLYNIYAGNGGSPDEQISEIVSRNDDMVSFADQQNDENAIGAYSGMMLIPVLTAGLKLLIDMMYFFFAMMSYMGGNI